MKEKEVKVKSIDDLIKDEQEAVEGYDKVINLIVEEADNKMCGCRAHMLEVLNHIRTEELEHIQELNELKEMLIKKEEEKEEINEAYELFGVGGEY